MARIHHGCGTEIANNGSDYSPEELDFLKAVDRYKRAMSIKFLTVCEYLLILKELGYERKEVMKNGSEDNSSGTGKNGATTSTDYQYNPNGV